MGGLSMQGTFVIMETRYAWGLACLERWSHRGPGMWGKIGDQTYLEHLKILKLVFYEPRTLKVQSDWLKLYAWKWIFWANQIWPKVDEVRRIRVLKFSNVPGMSGPQFYQSSTHTWSPMWSTFQACLAPFIYNVSGIYSLHYDQCFLHSWSPPR